MKTTRFFGLLIVATLFVFACTTSDLEIGSDYDNRFAKKDYGYIDHTGPTLVDNIQLPKFAPTEANDVKQSEVESRLKVASQTNVVPIFKLKFQKTSCFGFCPSYTSTILADGSILYEGGPYAPVQGIWRAQAEPGLVDYIILQLRIIDFFRLDRLYPADGDQIVDLPATIIRAELHNLTHTTKIMYDAPSNLETFSGILERYLVPVPTASHTRQ